MINQRVILVTDSNPQIINADISRRDLEGNSILATKKITEALQACVKDVLVYTDTENFINDITKFKSDIIFPMKYGKNAPNSKSIIPAVCEGKNLFYVGADDYAHMICNDKYASKLFAREFGIKSATSILVRNIDYPKQILSRIRMLNLPVIIKPNFGGGSTGISEKNICFDYEAALDLCILLYTYHKMPILIEEYISGEEVELILVGNHKNVVFSEEVQLLMSNKKYYTTEVWGYETKKVDDTNVDFKMSSLISQKDKQNIQTLFASFSKIEFMRVDGRIKDGEFYLIELSPDCYLGDDCAFYYAFSQKGYSFPEMFEFLIKNAQFHYQY